MLHHKKFFVGRCNIDVKMHVIFPSRELTQFSRPLQRRMNLDHCQLLPLSAQAWSLNDLTSESREDSRDTYAQGADKVRNN